MKRRLVGLLCGFIACLGWHMAQAGAQELEINLPVEFETLQIIMTDEQQTWLAGYTGEPMSSKPAVLQVTSVAVSNLIQHNGSLFLPLNDEHPRVHFCTPLITMPYAPLRSKGFGFIATCAYIAFSSWN